MMVQEIHCPECLADKEVDCPRDNEDNIIKDKPKDDFISATSLAIESLEETKEKLMLTQAFAPKIRDKVRCLRLMADIDIEILDIVKQGVLSNSLTANSLLY